MSSEKVIKDTTGDETTVELSLGEVRMGCTVGHDHTVMYFTPKQARKLAKALKKAAKQAKQRA